MRRVVEAQDELVGHGRRRREDPVFLAARAAIGLVTITGAIATMVLWPSLPPFLASMAGAIGAVILGDAATRVPGRRFSATVRRVLGVVQRVLLVTLVLTGALVDVFGVWLLGWVMSQGASGPSGTWGLAAGGLGLLAIGTVLLSTSAEPIIYSVENRRWPQRVGDAGSFVLGTGALLGLTAVMWHLAGATGVLTAVFAVGLAQIGWLITARLQRARLVSVLAGATGALTLAAVRESCRSSAPATSPLLEPLLNLESLVQQGGWRMPLSYRPRQLFDLEVRAMIEALLALAIAPQYALRLKGLAGRFQGELEAMSPADRTVETALFATDLRHLCTGSRQWASAGVPMDHPAVRTDPAGRKPADATRALNLA